MESLSTRTMALIGIAVLALLVRIAGFWYGFHGMATDLPDPTNEQMRLIVGLAATLVFLGVIAEFVRQGDLSAPAVLIFLGVGAVIGASFTTDLPYAIGGLYGELFMYRLVVLLGGTAAVGGLLALASILRPEAVSWWRTALVGPVLLETGVHAAILVALWSFAIPLRGAPAELGWTLPLVLP